MIQVDTQLELLLTEMVRQLKINNAIGLAQVMQQDITVPVQAEKVARYLGSVENRFGGINND